MGREGTGGDAVAGGYASSTVDRMRVAAAIDCNGERGWRAADVGIFRDFQGRRIGSAVWIPHAAVALARSPVGIRILSTCPPGRDHTQHGGGGGQEDEEEGEDEVGEEFHEWTN